MFELYWIVQFWSKNVQIHQKWSKLHLKCSKSIKQLSKLIKKSIKLVIIDLLIRIIFVVCNLKYILMKNRSILIKNWSNISQFNWKMVEIIWILSSSYSRSPNSSFDFKSDRFQCSNFGWLDIQIRFAGPNCLSLIPEAFTLTHLFFNMTLSKFKNDFG